MAGVAAAVAAGVPRAYLTGDSERLKAALVDASLVDRVEIVAAPDAAAAVDIAAELVRDGSARYVVKGSLSTGTLLKGLMSRQKLGTGGLAGHVYLIEAPAYDRRAVFTTDAGVNIGPDLATKAQLVRNVAGVFAALGLGTPRIAALSAAEHIRADLASGVHAALLTAMARRGQLGDIALDGPMSIDAALSVRAARMKGIGGDVAGQADVLLAPDLDAANMVSKALIGETGQAMGVIVGLRAPIALPSRGDSVQTRANSIRLASYLSLAVAPAV
jgi:phosphotransacetylase